jgi:hypothetical protein
VQADPHDVRDERAAEVAEHVHRAADDAGVNPADFDAQRPRWGHAERGEHGGEREKKR